jgi:hypothetical protein
MIARRASFCAMLAFPTLGLIACSGGVSGGLNNSSGGASAGSYVPQSVASAAFQTASDVPLPTYLPDALGGRVLPAVLTKPVVDDSGSFAGGPILIGTNTAKGTGIEGYASASGGTGVVGIASSSNTGGVAILGEATGTGGNGVYGYSGKGIGVRGFTGNGASYAGYFSNVASSSSVALDAVANGTALLATSSQGFGVDGATSFASAEGGGGAGVFGEDRSTDGGSGDSGVFGSSTGGSGVSGNSTNFVGVYAFSQSGNGVFAQSNATLTCNNPGNWAFCPAANPALEINSPSSTGTVRGMAIVATGGGTPIMSLDGAGNMIILGNLVVDGNIAYTSIGPTCFEPPGTCVTPQYSARNQSVSAQVERVGDAQLVGGRAYVAIDSDLARRMDSSQKYHVFVTPEGDCNGLYVTAKTRTGFTVRELHGGTSTLAFDYRIVASALPVSLPRPVGGGSGRKGLPLYRTLGPRSGSRP